MPDIEFPTNQKAVQNVFQRDPSTSICISKFPMIRDPYEHQTVFVAASRQGEFAGEGLFAKRMIKKGDLVALFNGLRQRDPIYSKNTLAFSDYRIALDRSISLDISEKFKNLATYRATLGHKTCHSFKSNSVFTQINHPRFGRIMAIVANDDIPCHGEILVSYNYRICQAPEWYVELWFKHLREDNNLTEEEVYQAAKKESRLSQLPLRVPPPPRTSSRFLPCGKCKEHIGLAEDSFTCDICDVWHHLKCKISDWDVKDDEPCIDVNKSFICDNCSRFR